MLLKDLLVAPTPFPVELSNDGGATLNADLINPVLVTIECQQAQVANQAGALNTVHDAIRSE